MVTSVVKSVGSAGGRNYSSIAAFLAARPSDLRAGTGTDETWTAELYNDSTFSVSTTTTASGVSSDSTHYTHITVAAGQSFMDAPSNALRYNNANGVSIELSGGYQTVLHASEAYFRMSRLQVYAAASNSNGLKNNGGNGRVENCIIGGGAHNSVTGSNGCIHLDTATIRNCLIQPAYVVVNDAALVASGTCNVYNVTMIAPASSSGLRAISYNYSSGSVIKNVAAFGFVTWVSTPGGVTIANCLTDYASPATGWTGSIAYTSATFTSLTSGSENFKIPSGSALVDVGATDTNAGADIFGTTRPQGAAYDVGAYEYVSGGPPPGRGLFLPPTMTGLGSGGSFFGDRL